MLNQQGVVVQHTAMAAQFVDCILKVDMSNDPITVEIVYLADVSGQTHFVADTGVPGAKCKNAVSQRIASLS